VRTGDAGLPSWTNLLPAVLDENKARVGTLPKTALAVTNMNNTDNSASAIEDFDRSITLPLNAHRKSKRASKKLKIFRRSGRFAGKNGVSVGYLKYNILNDLNNYIFFRRARQSKNCWF
jgi:hypothetical protein